MQLNQYLLPRCCKSKPLESKYTLFILLCYYQQSLCCYTSFIVNTIHFLSSSNLSPSPCPLHWAFLPAQTSPLKTSLKYLSPVNNIQLPQSPLVAGIMDSCMLPFLVLFLQVGGVALFIVTKREEYWEIKAACGLALVVNHTMSNLQEIMCGVQACFAIWFTALPGCQ